jgi:hypothetical protein
MTTAAPKEKNTLMILLVFGEMEFDI